MAKSNISYDGTTPITPHEYKDVWQKAFDHFNNELFGGQLPDAMIVFARNAHSLGHYAPKRYLSRNGGFTKDEISLNQDGFKDRPDKTIAGTFVQQMVSHWQEYHGHIKPTRGYHNKEWAAKMKSIGLYPSSTGKPGGREIGQHVDHYIIADGAYSYSYERLAETGWTPTLESAPRAGSKKDPSHTPFTCRHCGQKARGKPSLAILCMHCTTDALPDLKIDWRKLQMVADEALVEAQSYDAAEPEPEAPPPWDDTNQPDEGEQAAAPAKRKPGRPKGAKNKTRVASYDGNVAPSLEPELEPDRLNEKLTADRMARKPKRHGRPPGSKNKPKPQVAA
jgi:hypothetical protein